MAVHHCRQIESLIRFLGSKEEEEEEAEEAEEEEEEEEKSVDKFFFPSNCDRRLSQWSLINDDLRASKEEEEEEKGKEEVFLFDISAVIECVVDNTKSPLSSNPIYGQQRVDYIGTRRLP
ncbi:hypothetical protein HZH66_004586 [Vespula vulgaris]|uniref:Uncharacterized protein n=1 Tax=Vespula vulgaris TaxID=7454 RepID=A0A834NBR3_VESVU|nr:hypothetical protein HZH66_004586 [Vespula vulgaris]